MILFIAILYVLASLVSVVMYWIDKRAAQAGRRRVKENTLHLIDLVGGWPGALVIRPVIRHKTIDLKFRVVLWGIILLHAVAWGVYLFFVLKRS